MRSHFLSLKILAIIILVAIFWIGLFFITSLVSERQAYQQAFLKEISQNNISPQTVIAPYIQVPYQEQKTCLDEQKKSYPCTEENWMYIGADSTQWTSNFNVSDDTYKRTIYRAISYQANLTAKGIFQKTQLENKTYLWDRAEIIFPVHNPRGLDQQPILKILNKNYAFEMSAQGSDRSGFDFMHISAKKYPELISAIQNGFHFDLTANLTGLSKFTLIPTSRSVTYQAKGNWADIKYDGQNLPYEKTSTQQQFNAQWKNIAIGHQNLNKFIHCESDECTRQFVQGNYLQKESYAETASYTPINQEKIGLSAEFLESVNVYTQTDRAIKYGIVIIIITFGCFFLFEVLKGLRIHPIQYSLVAMAQGIFFVLLLSISEYYAFAWAYIVAALACIGLMTWYLYFVMKGFKAAALFSIILMTLYSIMYMLLQSSGKTFLIGSVISFIILAVVMFITRHIDWYSIGNKPTPTLKPYTPSNSE
ncbi:cell envelope integrity protein CreD [Acinetobacter johnsonii]|uniref:cell envelope integrity protein CreD n=1 Tax=Acinetobacter johnsonii TaxID=40214 RepID=UPI002446FE68|nr:cell envelope integrity protein CreD [Acinetobacter johnsonii]MDH1487636.1 cell envelope integrity protein CreD [Acinetobacter johnsonii]MDH1613567.1 cell envelope integrity protein CreD [Acinetobacter johnsonii]MDH1802197.1 cell envelope integrity protein CreD [Acinetobacter johnsonii]